MPKEVYMSCGNCCPSKLCPVSFGFALGLTAALATLVWVIWVMNYGATPMMVQFNIPVPTLAEGCMRALWMFLKGLLVGAVFAFLYDMTLCCCKKMRGHKDESHPSCDTNKKI